MALITIASPSPLSPRLLTTTKTLSHNLILPQPTSTLNFSVRSQNSPPDSNPAPLPGDAEQSRKPPASGVGFGDAGPMKQSSSGVSSKKKQKGKRERAAVIRRIPVEKPAFLSQVDERKVEEEKRNESAFLLAWLGLGGLILVEGIALAASGFLPEEWDKFFVKYLYPSFTPTVFLFVAGTVAYSVSKYLQNEKINDQK